jgi:hypothetical protein
VSNARSGIVGNGVAGSPDARKKLNVATGQQCPMVPVQIVGKAPDLVEHASADCAIRAKRELGLLHLGAYLSELETGQIGAKLLYI